MQRQPYRTLSNSIICEVPLNGFEPKLAHILATLGRQTDQVKAQA